jgi:predicted murein hydrolase (TIGR00659 family)
MVWLAAGSFFMTIGIYWAAKRLYQRYQKVFLSPLIITPAAIGALLLLTGLPYEAYRQGTLPLTFLLEPATAAFAVPLYKYLPVLKKYALEILVSVLAGSAIAIASTALAAYGLGLAPELILTLIPRSVTTPIAMEIAELIGGLPPLTAAVVILTGITGSVMAQYVIRLLRIENEVVKGIMIGTSSHAIGTAKAFEISPLAGSISSISMILAALVTVLAVVWFA